MRYFVYKDTQILGPFEREELDGAGGLRPETLICAEGISGRRDGDWRALAEVAELAGVATLPPQSLGLVDHPIQQSPLIERFELESLGVMTADEAEPEWLRGLFDDSEFKQRFGLSLKPETSGEALSQAQGRIADLTTELSSLQARLLELEGEQSRLLERLASGDAVIAPAQPAAAAPAPARAPAAAPAPAPAAEPPADPLHAPRFALNRAAAAPAPAPAPAAPPAPAAAPAPAPADAAAPPAPESPAPRFALSRAPAAAVLSLKLGPAKKFRKTGEPEPAPPPAAAAAPAPIPVAAAAPPLASLPLAPEPAAVPPQPEPAAPMFGAPSLPAMPTLSPASAAAEAPITLVAPTPVPMPTPAELTPIPAPVTSSGPATPAPTIPPGGAMTPNPLQPPMTMRFQVAPSPTTPGPVPIDPTPTGGFPAGATPAPGPATQDLLARLAKPAPAPETRAPAPRPPQSKKFIVFSGAAVAVLGLLAFAFLRNSRDLKTMTDMGADQKPMGIDDTQTSATPKPASAIPPRPGMPAPTPAPAPAPPPVVDLGEQAIALVKEYPLFGDRGTVAQWLQYSFTANPGNGNKEEWTAGAIEGAYLVQYRVLPGPGSSIKEAISYVFEADLERGLVRGKNPAARELMGGNAPSLPSAKPAKGAKGKAKGGKPSVKAAKTKAAPKPRRAKPAPIVPHEVPLAPLPSDAELLPPAENDSRFSNDTVNPPL